MAAELYASDEDQQQQHSLLFLIVDAVAFWMRSPLAFWIVTLPIAGLAAAVAHLLDSQQALAEFRNHWGWDFLFATIYALFLDRWIKASLLDDASPCDETDNRRRSIVSPRFLGLGTALFLIAFGLTCLTPLTIEMNVVLWAASAALFALYLPALSAAAPLSLGQAFAVGRGVQAQLFLLIAGAVAVVLLSGIGLREAATYLPTRPVWMPAALAAGQQVVNCVMLAVIGNVLAALFRDITNWHQPEPDDRPYRGMGWTRQKNPAP